MVSLIPNVTDELVSHHFKTQSHTKQAYFFNFRRHKNYISIAAMIENIEHFKKTEEEFNLRK